MCLLCRDKTLKQAEELFWSVETFRLEVVCDWLQKPMEHNFTIVRRKKRTFWFGNNVAQRNKCMCTRRSEDLFECMNAFLAPFVPCLWGWRTSVTSQRRLLFVDVRPWLPRRHWEGYMYIWTHVDKKTMLCVSHACGAPVHPEPCNMTHPLLMKN